MRISVPETLLNFRESPGIIWLDEEQLKLWNQDGDYREAVMSFVSGVAADESRIIRIMSSDGALLAIESPWVL